MSDPAKSLLAFLRPIWRILIIFLLLASVILIIDQSGKKPAVKKLHFALVQYNDAPLSEMTRDGLLDALPASGFIEGRNCEISVSNAQGDVATVNLMIDEVAGNPPDLLFITSTPTLQVAIKKISKIPIVFTTVADPIVAGAGKSFGDHLPNLTGISTMGDYSGMITWVKKILPSAKVIGTLFSPGESNSVHNAEAFEKMVAGAGMTLLKVPVNSSQDIPDACRSMLMKKPDVICQVLDNLISSSSATVIKIAKDHKIPVFGFVSDQSQQGAVVVVARDYRQAGADAVKLAKRILDGENPAKIPFEFVSKTNIMINLPAAAEFRIRIPEEVMKDTTIIFVKPEKIEKKN